jgi:hypothetical protein
MTMDPVPDFEPITILDRRECWDLIRTQEVGRLGIAIANKPDIFPINFVVDHSSVVFRTAEGTKFAAAVLGEAVAFECDGYDPDAGEAWSVVLKGTAVEVENMYEFFDVLDLPLFPWHGAPKSRFVRIVPTEVTGRRFHVVDRSTWGYKSRERAREE